MSKKLSDKDSAAILEARVTALELLVTSLYAGELAKFPDPVAAGEVFMRRFLDAEEKVRAEHGEHSYTMRITEALSATIDRAVAHALDRKGSEGPGSPSRRKS